MTVDDDESSESLVLVARAVRTRGLKGEVVAELLTDFPQRFDETDELVAIKPDGTHETVELENYWLQNDRVILKFAGIDDCEAAKEIVGYGFAVPESEAVDLPDDTFYDWELEGCSVQLLTGDIVGEVESVLKTGGPDILLVRTTDGNERLVPLADDICIKVDPANKLIVIDPPEGLFDL
jgi:16S rRNA processing protein RimM